VTLTENDLKPVKPCNVSIAQSSWLMPVRTRRFIAHALDMVSKGVSLVNDKKLTHCSLENNLTRLVARSAPT
jgi:hypothetical protein